MTQADMGAASGVSKQCYAFYDSSRKFPMPKTYARFRAALIEAGATAEEVERMDNFYMDDRDIRTRRRKRERDKAGKEGGE